MEMGDSSFMRGGPASRVTRRSEISLLVMEHDNGRSVQVPELRQDPRGVEEVCRSCLAPPWRSKTGIESENPCSSAPMQDSLRERLKRHRDAVAGRVMIPDSWGQENFLKEWINYSPFDTLLAPKGLSSAREALMAEGRRAPSQRMRIESRC